MAAKVQRRVHTAVEQRKQDQEQGARFDEEVRAINEAYDERSVTPADEIVGDTLIGRGWLYQQLRHLDPKVPLPRWWLVRDPDDDRPTLGVHLDGRGGYRVEWICLDGCVHTAHIASGVALVQAMPDIEAWQPPVGHGADASPPGWDVRRVIL